MYRDSKDNEYRANNTQKTHEEDHREERHIYRLDELSDYKVKSEDPDVRGWKVKAANGDMVGEVDNLIVNKETERVVYLDVDADDSIISSNYEPYNRSANDGVHDFRNAEGETHLIVPVGMADLDEDNKIVNVNNVDHKTFAETKRVAKKEPISRKYEEVILESYTRPQSPVNYPSDNTFYERKEFDHSKFRKRFHAD